MTAFATAIGTARIPVFDFASRYAELGETIRNGMQADIQRFGVELTQLLIENVSLPPEVEAAMDKRASIGILGNMQQYAQYQAANAIEASANNPAGGGTPALDFGVGMAMGQQLINAMQQPQAPAAVATAPMAPPPPPIAVQWFISRDGQNIGPFTPDQLVPNGLTAQTYVWRNGMAGWLRASEVTELNSILPTLPPPPPAA